MKAQQTSKVWSIYLYPTYNVACQLDTISQVEAHNINGIEGWVGIASGPMFSRVPENLI